jgi:hypothetical protein
MSDSATSERFTLEDVERFEDRLRHAEQYMDEALRAVRDAIALLPNPDEEAA